MVNKQISTELSCIYTVVNYFFIVYMLVFTEVQETDQLEAVTLVTLIKSGQF